jgi:hypothetical protein
VFHVESGNSNGTDLSGVDFAISFHVPSNLTAGNWTVGLIVDEGASEEQGQAIEGIVSGQAGGPFAEFAPLIGEVQPPRRAGVTFSGGDAPSASVQGGTEIRFEPFRGPDGQPTTLSNAMVTFGPTYAVGKGPAEGSPSAEATSRFTGSRERSITRRNRPFCWKYRRKSVALHLGLRRDHAVGGANPERTAHRD